MIGAASKALAKACENIRRVLILDPAPASARLLADLLRNMAGCEVWTASTNARALELVGSVEPQLIFIEYSGERLDGPAFTRALRRSTLACRQAPVIMVTHEATAASILAARDSGVHEFLRKPYTIKDVERRLEAVLIQSRGWIEAVAYVGPDRRRFNSGDYRGASKRRTDAVNRAAPHREAIIQALKIVRAAMRASEDDPVQALRALLVQAQDLRKAAVAASDLALSDAAAELERYLNQVGRGGALTQAGLQTATRRLWAYLPSDEAGQAA